jgi:hypothetical protein
VTLWVDHKFARWDIVCCLLACASVIAVNVARITVMGVSHWHYETFHYGWGATAANLTTLVFILAFTVIGARREIFSGV